MLGKLNVVVNAKVVAELLSCLINNPYRQKVPKFVTFFICSGNGRMGVVIHSPEGCGCLFALVGMPPVLFVVAGEGIATMNGLGRVSIVTGVQLLWKTVTANLV